MEIIDKSNRETFLEIMQLPKDIKDYDIDEQYYFIHQNIEALKENIFIENTVIENKPDALSQKQEEKWQNALLNFQRENYLDAYFEIIDFIDDCDKKEADNFFEEEMNNIKSILIGIDKKITESVNLGEAYKKAINRLNINSEFNIWIGEGSIAPTDTNEDYKAFSLYDNKMEVEWLGKNKLIEDNQIITKIKEIIIKYKNELYDFSKRQEDEEGEFPTGEIIIGTYDDECSGSINLLKFAVCNRFENKELNDFYKKFKEELFSVIEDSLTNKEKTDKNNEKLTDKGINEKYCGLSGVISVKNIIKGATNGK